MKLSDIVNLTPHALDIETVESGTIHIQPTMGYCKICGGRGWIIPPDSSMDRTCTACKGTGQVAQVARVVPVQAPRVEEPLVVETGGHHGTCNAPYDPCPCENVSVPRVREARGRVEGLPDPCGGCAGEGGYWFPGVLPDGTAGQLFHDCNECGGRS